MIPVPVGADHEYVVPPGIVPVGVYEKATPLHEGVASACEAIVITGFMVTEVVKAAPAQVPEVGVTTYVAVAAEAIVLVSVPLT